MGIWCNGNIPKFGWNRGGAGAHKSCIISETVQDRTKVTSLLRSNRKSHVHHAWCALSIHSKISDLDDIERQKRHAEMNEIYRRTTSVTKLLGELDWPMLSDRRTSVTFLQSSRWSLCHLSHAVYLSLRDKHAVCAALITQVSSPSLHELMSTNIPSFHVHFSIGTLCLLKSVSSTPCSRCLHASQLIWSTKPWHSSDKGRCPLLDICWRTEERTLVFKGLGIRAYRSYAARRINSTDLINNNLRNPLRPDSLSVYFICIVNVNKYRNWLSLMAFNAFMSELCRLMWYVINICISDEDAHLYI